MPFSAFSPALLCPERFTSALSQRCPPGKTLSPHDHVTTFFVDSEHCRVLSFTPEPTAQPTALR